MTLGRKPMNKDALCRALSYSLSYTHYLPSLFPDAYFFHFLARSSSSFTFQLPLTFFNPLSLLSPSLNHFIMEMDLIQLHHACGDHDLPFLATTCPFYLVFPFSLLLGGFHGTTFDIFSHDFLAFPSLSEDIYI